MRMVRIHCYLESYLFKGKKFREFNGYGVASRLIKAVEEEAKNRSYETIEVLAFPDEHNWHPKAMYAKRGYQEVRRIREMSIMGKVLL